MIQTHIVYGLIDPRTNELRYVGKSSSGMRRPREHLCAKRASGRTHKDRWLRQLYADGGQVPIILVLRDCADNTECLAQEIYLIALFRQAGFPLTNITPGGDGCPGHVITERQRKAIVDANSRRVWTPGMRAKAGAAHRGYKPTAATLAKIGTALRGKKRPEAVKEKIRAAHLGRKHSAEHVEKVAAWHRGRERTPEQVAKITALRNTPEFRSKITAARNTPEYKARQRASALAVWKKRKT